MKNELHKKNPCELGWLHSLCRHYSLWLLLIAAILSLVGCQTDEKKTDQQTNESQRFFVTIIHH